MTPVTGRPARLDAGGRVWIALSSVWRFRGEILLAAQVLSALRKTAREITREYIRKRVETQLRHSLALVAIQVGVLGLAWLLDELHGTLFTRAVASAALWGVTLHNAVVLFGSTLPEIVSLRRTLRSKTGYAIKYVLQVSIVAELMQLNAVFLFVCLSAAVSSRTLIGGSFSYLDPWLELLARLG